MKIMYTLSSVMLILLVGYIGLKKSSDQRVVEESDCFNKVLVQEGKPEPKLCDDNLLWRAFHGENFLIQLPGQVFKFGTEDNITFDTNPTNDPPIESDFYLDIHHSSPSCSPQAIGISQPIDLTDSNDENTIWGRMDEREISRGDFPPEYTDICGPFSGESMYAFCSEKDDKRVVICINQQTDDAKQAEEIFKSFRWTE